MAHAHNFAPRRLSASILTCHHPRQGLSPLTELPTHRGSMSTLSISKKVFSKRNPAPCHTLSNRAGASPQAPGLFSSSTPLPLSTAACKLVPILVGNPPPPVKGLGLSYHPRYILLSYQLQGCFSKEISPALSEQVKTLKCALPQAPNPSYTLPCELLINACPLHQGPGSWQGLGLPHKALHHCSASTNR